MDIVAQKIRQATALLDELDIDMWLVFVRETMMMADPVLPLVVGENAVWQSFFIYTRSGRSAALVGNFDRALFERHGRFDDVITYTQDARPALRQLLEKFNPRHIAVNYSPDNPAADGLTHGMFLLLNTYLADTPYHGRLISAQEVCSKLRSRKLPVEIDFISKAAQMACDAWADASQLVAPGMTEIQIAALVDRAIADLGAANSFPTIVNAGSKSDPGHGQPTETVLEPGDLLHIDFGVRHNNYCSDLQRLIYFPKPGEKSAPPELIRAFNLVRDIITATAEFCRPGMPGWQVDALARRMLADHGYPEYQHALGHQLGRDVHDGGAIIGPRWERYGVTPTIPLEAGNVFTLELEIMLPGIGCVGLEEDAVLTEAGALFLCPRQTTLAIR